MREHQTYTAVEVALPPAATTGSRNGVTIDRAGCDAMDFVAFTGALTAADASNKLAFKLQHGDAANLSDVADVPADDVIADGTPGGAAAAVDGLTDNDKVVTRLSYRGTKRYVRIVGTETGTFDGIVGAVCIKGHLKNQPAA